MLRAVLIMACEQRYQGLHGIHNITVLEMEDNEVNKQDANDTGFQMSLDVIESFDVLDAMDEEEFEASCEDDSTYEQYLEDLTEEAIEYYVFRQKDDSKLTLEEVEEMVGNYGFEITKQSDFNEHFEDW